MNKIFKNLFNVLKIKEYFLSFLILTFLFCFLYYELTIYGIKNLDNFIYFNGVIYVGFYIILTLLISILLGLWLTLMFYKFQCLKKIDLNHSGTSFLGFLLGIFGTGCAGCSFTLFSYFLSFFGLALGLARLPLQGLELKILSVILLLISNYFILNNVNSVCKKPLNKKALPK